MERMSAVVGSDMMEGLMISLFSVVFFIVVMFIVLVVALRFIGTSLVSPPAYVVSIVHFYGFIVVASSCTSVSLRFVFVVVVR